MSYPDYTMYKKTYERDEIKIIVKHIADYDMPGFRDDGEFISKPEKYCIDRSKGILLGEYRYEPESPEYPDEPELDEPLDKDLVYPAWEVGPMPRTIESRMPNYKINYKRHDYMVKLWEMERVRWDLELLELNPDLKAYREAWNSYNDQVRALDKAYNEAYEKWEEMPYEVLADYPYHHWVDQHSYEYFRPTPGGESLASAFSHCKSEEEKQEYIKYALQDWERAEELNDGEWCYMGVQATVYVSGIELGEASVWGVESDGGDDYLKEIEQDEINEALSEAKLHHLELGALVIDWDQYGTPMTENKAWEVKEKSY